MDRERVVYTVYHFERGCFDSIWTSLWVKNLCSNTSYIQVHLEMFDLFCVHRNPNDTGAPSGVGMKFAKSGPGPYTITEFVAGVGACSPARQAQLSFNELILWVSVHLVMPTSLLLPLDANIFWLVSLFSILVVYHEWHTNLTHIHQAAAALNGQFKIGDLLHSVDNQSGSFLQRFTVGDLFSNFRYIIQHNEYVHALHVNMNTRTCTLH